MLYLSARLFELTIRYVYFLLMDPWNFGKRLTQNPPQFFFIHIFNFASNYINKIFIVEDAFIFFNLKLCLYLKIHTQCFTT